MEFQSPRRPSSTEVGDTTHSRPLAGSVNTPTPTTQQHHHSTLITQETSANHSMASNSAGSQQLLKSPVSASAAKDELMDFQMGLVRSKLRTRTEAEEASSRALLADLALTASSPAVARAVVGGAVTTPALESDRQKLQKTVAQANSALSDRNTKLATAERELAQFSTVCLRSTTRAEDRVATHESALKRAQAEKQRQEKLLEDLTTELINARRGLSQYQIAIDEDKKALDSAKTAMAQTRARELEVEASVKGSRAGALEQQRQAELKIQSLQERLQHYQQSIAKLSQISSEERAAHSGVVVAARSKVTAIRRQQTEAKETIHALRRALQEATEVEEEAARRYNKKEAELDEEALMEKRMSLQDAATAHDEAMRQFRTTTEQRQEHLRAQADTLRLELATAEKTFNVITNHQTQLLREIQVSQGQLSALSQINSRTSAAEESLNALAVEVKEQEEQLADYKTVLEVTNERLSVLKDTVAPMEDVAASIALLRAQVEERRAALSDTQAQHNLQAATREENLKSINQARLAAEKTVSTKYAAIAESNEDTAQTAEAIKSQIRVIDVEAATMEDNIRSLLQRNQTLVASLDEIERHRKALEETILRQKEEARRAAQALLVQLESN